MKQLIVVRHAKAEMSELGQRDFERPLSKRGFSDASDMGKRLQAKVIKVDGIFSSNAIRALTTATLIANELHFFVDDIVITSHLYLASNEEIRSFIYSISNNLNSVILVCHNDGITQFINSIGKTVTDNVVTCGIAIIQVETEDWTEFDTAKKKIVWYDYPKSNLVN